MIRGLSTDRSVCQDTTISEEESPPNCKCSPATGGVVTGSVEGGAAGAAAIASLPTKAADTAAPAAIPAALNSLRRLSSRLKPVCFVVMAALSLLASPEI